MKSKSKSSARKKPRWHTFTIDRATWLHGEGSEPSFLLRRRDGKRCCVGFYLKSLGVPDAKVLGKRMLSDVVDPRDRKWLRYFAQDGVETHTLMTLYGYNDGCGEPEKTREGLITQLFAKLGAKVTFKGPRRPRRSETV